MKTHRDTMVFVESWMDLAYALESLRIKLFCRRRLANPLQDLYELYIDKVRAKEICPQGGYQNYRMFLRFREASHGRLTLEEEVYLIRLLKGSVSKWFVPYVLNVIDIFSVELLDKLIDTAIEEKEPEYASIFLAPAIRVFDLKVNLELQDRFRKATSRNKTRVLRAFDKVGSRKITRHTSDGFVESYGAKYVWSGSKFRNTLRMKDADFIEYGRSIRFINTNRLEALLTEYLKTTSKGIRSVIASYLPKELNEFPPDLHQLADEYLNTMNRRFV